jgi:hypothetical protein
MSDLRFVSPYERIQGPLAAAKGAYPQLVVAVEGEVVFTFATFHWAQVGRADNGSVTIRFDDRVSVTLQPGAVLLLHDFQVAA